VLAYKLMSKYNLFEFNESGMVVLVATSSPYLRIDCERSRGSSSATVNCHHASDPCSLKTSWMNLHVSADIGLLVVEDRDGHSSRKCISLHGWLPSPPLCSIKRSASSCASRRDSCDSDCGGEVGRDARINLTATLRG
jgi:hypothetical protein